MRNSIQRQLIVDAVKALPHPTAAHIHQYIRARYPSISLGTVYRNLNCLVKGGGISRLSLAESPDRYEINSVPHYHALCRGCGAIMDIKAIPEEVLQALEQSAAQDSGFDIRGHRLYFSGFCPQCRRDDQ